MAEKFLEKMDLEEVMEEISMTRLGEMLVNKGYDSGYGTGYDTGHSKGVEEGKLTAARNLLGSVSPDVLAKALDLPLETILKLKEEKDPASEYFSSAQMFRSCCINHMSGIFICFMRIGRI